MRRKAIEALLIIICFILQCTVFQALSLAGIVPNLLLIVTSSLGFMRGEKEGMAVGFLFRSSDGYFLRSAVWLLQSSVHVPGIRKRPVSSDVLR